MPSHLRHRIAAFAALVIGALAAASAEAQITAPQLVPGPQSPGSQVGQASLEEFLINRLRATTEGQQSYVREVVKLVDERKLERRIVLALERYARRKSPFFPLPVFERALRFQGARRGVDVPMIKEIVARDGASAARAISDSRVR